MFLCKYLSFFPESSLQRFPSIFFQKFLCKCFLRIVSRSFSTNMFLQNFSPEVSLQMFSSKMFSPEVSLQMFSSKDVLQKFFCKYVLRCFLQMFRCRCLFSKTFSPEVSPPIVVSNIFSPEVSLRIFSSKILHCESKNPTIQGPRQNQRFNVVARSKNYP